MMKFLLLLMLTQYAVKCDDTSNYYVVEVPEDEPAASGPPPRALRPPLRVYWNVPTMQCKSKKIPFTDLDQYGIMQNKDDSFRGEKIAIMYDPGLFPALLKNESSGEIKFRNGGVPQEGNMTLHLEAFRAALDQSIPDENFDGVGIIDFESWRPVFRQNFGVLVPYKDVSYEIEKKLHWWWTDDWIQTEAKQRFEAAARAYMQTTLSFAKQLRPRALWGYYGFPYCFNMGTNNKVERCADNVNTENDGTYWLWGESTALFPSVYSTVDLTSSQLAALIRGRVKEANRVRRNYSPVLPYFWFRYRDGGFMSEVDLSTALKTLYTSNATGLIIWGSSNDVNSFDKCQNLLKYVQNTLGPAIAKYTKATLRQEDEYMSTTESIDYNTESSNTFTDTIVSHKANVSADNTTIVNTRFIPIDPKFPWEPPANYSEEISHYVEEELLKKEGYNETKLDNEYPNINKSLLMELMINSILDSILEGSDFMPDNSTLDSITNNEYETMLNSGEYGTYVPSTDDDYLTSTSQYVTENTNNNSMVTKSPLRNTDEIYKIEPSDDTNFLSTEGKEFTTEKNIYIDITSKNYETTSQYDKDIGSFGNDDTLFNPHHIVIDTVEGTTEDLTLIPNSTLTDVVDEQKTVTERDDSYSTSTSNTIIESTEFVIQNIAEFITERPDILKKFKKENLSAGEEFLELSTDLPLAERSEPEQVVIYIS